jgi:uncharacterized protein (DUF1330 family)
MAAYIVVNATITDWALLDEYGAAAGGTLGGHQLKIHVVTNEATILEGEAGERVVVMEFPSRGFAWLAARRAERPDLDTVKACSSTR